MKTNILTPIALFLSTLSFGQCDCTELLQFGVYNYFNSTDNVQNYSKIETEINNSFERNKQKGNSAGASYKVFSANMSKSDAEMLRKVTSSSSLNEKDQNVLRTQSAKYISKDMLAAYKECLKLCDDSGLKPKAKLPSDGKFEIVSFTMEYEKKKYVPRVPVMQSIDIVPNGCYTCTGTLIDLDKNNEPLKENVVYKMICERNIQKPPHKFPENKNEVTIAKSALISIHTDMGDYEIRIPELKERRSDYDYGMGQIVASMLTEKQFMDVHGKDWVLADGTDAPQSQYLKYINEHLPHMDGKLPDLRGVFLRGHNNGENINPDNNELGVAQEDAIRNITGNFLGSNPNQEASGVFYTESVNLGDENSWGRKPGKRIFFDASKLDGLKVSSENRPKNVTVNYFIKIN